MEQIEKLTETEKEVLEILKEKEKWTEWEIKRHSDREFDFDIKGKQRSIINEDFICEFSAWMPLCIIYNVDWTSNKIWKLSDGYGHKGYIPVQGYDWSGIRDSSGEAIWQMTKIALRMLGIYRAGRQI